MQVERMKAAILVENHKPLVVAEVELPKKLACGQVLVKVHYSGICGAQINEIDGAKGPDKFLPHLLGHEGSATVLEIGPGVRTIKKGDRVVMHWRQSNGIHSETPSYNWNGRKVNAGWVKIWRWDVAARAGGALPIDRWVLSLTVGAVFDVSEVSDASDHLEIGDEHQVRPGFSTAFEARLRLDEHFSLWAGAGLDVFSEDLVYRGEDEYGRQAVLIRCGALQGRLLVGAEIGIGLGRMAGESITGDQE